MPNEPPLKSCSRCNEPKPITCFQWRSDRQIYRAQCNQCLRAQRRNLSPEDNERLKQESNNACNICNSELSTEQLFIDHCHATNRVRGLLCHACNSGIGFFKDDIARLASAIIYLGRIA